MGEIDEPLKRDESDRQESRPRLSAGRLRRLLDYDPATGIFTHKVSRGIAKRGSIAGTVNSQGYRQIGVDGRLYYASRLAYLWMTGEWPPEEMDHIDRNPTDDRWENLRAVSRSGNNRNRKLPRQSDLPVGVKPHGHGFQAKIRVNGKIHYLGTYGTPESAASAYQRALRAVMSSGPGADLP